MAALDPRIEIVREKFGLDKSDFWEIPQKPGTWVAKHAALEVAAVKAGILFDLPVIVEKDAPGLVTSMIVQGVMDGRTEWATGETNPSNYRISGKQPSYPWAMSEKRAKDRVILKLIGIHGLVYSDAEGDFNAEPGDFTQSQPKAASRELYATVQQALRDAGNKGKAALRDYWTSELFIEAWESFPADWRQNLTEEKDAFIASFPKPTGRVDPNAALDRQYAETMGAN